MKSPYEILGVAKTASADDVRKAYRGLAKKLHPDLNPGDKSAEAKFKDVSIAYDLLSDNAKRAKFDAGEIDAAGNETAAARERQYYRDHPQARQQQNAYASSAGFEDFAGDDLFSELFRKQAEKQRNAKGADAQYRLTVSFLDAVNGGLQRISLPGGGALDVNIPAGIQEGQTLRLKGKGNASQGTGGHGDALVQIAVAPHAFFTRVGDDIFVELPVTIKEAALGGPVKVPTSTGSVMLNIPKASNTGALLRLKGKGVAGKGDQFVKLKIVLPQMPDAALNDFLSDWSPDASYDPRKEMQL
ncbi:MAG: DnaJ domain-containing protein [Alphaproteobacteria bacterium]|nr:DnaJ domain-containing protein [Alphaproteobacteria bacterium]